KLRSKFPEAVRKSVFPHLAKLAGKVPGTVGKKAKSLLTSLSHEPAMGFYITNSMMTDEMWQSLVKPEVAQQ
ncbi:MAG TPA: asparagine synthetase B, partial [Alteromonas macleodii]|nr:asparagine synthetase B [Alteromonas macleodii]